MAFTKTTWIEKAPPGVDAAQLNRIEVGIDQAHAGLAAALQQGVVGTSDLVFSYVSPQYGVDPGSAWIRDPQTGAMVYVNVPARVNLGGDSAFSPVGNDTSLLAQVILLPNGTVALQKGSEQAGAGAVTTMNRLGAVTDATLNSLYPAGWMRLWDVTAFRDISLNGVGVWRDRRTYARGDEPWQIVGNSNGNAVAFSNGWVNFGSTYATAAFKKDALGIVRLKGLVKSGTAQVIFPVPAGYRPAQDTILPGTAWKSASGYINPDFEVLSNGDVIGASTAVAKPWDWMSIEGSFGAA